MTTMTMARPGDWTPLDCDRDPVPGDPDVVDRHGREYQTTATTIHDAARQLRNLCSDSITRSDAVEAVRKKAEELAGTLDKLECRYDEAGSALVVYAPELRESQQLSLQALQAATPASDRLDTLNHQRQDVIQRWQSSCPSQEEADRVKDELHTLDAQRYQAKGDLEQAKRLLQEAVCNRDRAACACAERIDDAVESCSVKDGFWDRVAEVWQKFNEFLEKWGWVLDALLLAVTVALFFVPGGQLVGAALIAVKVARIAKLALTVASTLSTASQVGGKLVDGNVVGAAVTGLALLPIGRVIGKGAAKVAMPAVKRALEKTGKKTIKQVWGGKITQRSFVRLRDNSHGYVQESLNARRLWAASEITADNPLVSWSLKAGAIAVEGADDLARLGLATADAAGVTPGSQEGER